MRKDHLYDSGMFFPEKHTTKKIIPEERIPGPADRHRPDSEKNTDRISVRPVFFPLRSFRFSRSRKSFFQIRENVVNMFRAD